MPKSSTSFVLTPELEHFVARHLRAGRYATASEVMRAGLRALEAEETRTAAMLLAIDDGRTFGSAHASNVDLEEPSSSDLHLVAHALRELAQGDRARGRAGPPEDEEKLLARTAACTRVAAWLETRIQRRLLLLRTLTVSDTPKDVAS